MDIRTCKVVWAIGLVSGVLFNPLLTSWAASSAGKTRPSKVAPPENETDETEAQEDEPEHKSLRKPRNTMKYQQLSVEGGGPGFASLLFSKQFLDVLSLDIGVGITGTLTSASYLVGSIEKGHFFEATGGLSYQFVEEGSHIYVGAGYRRLALGLGFHFRATAYVIFGNNSMSTPGLLPLSRSIGLMPGATLGYSF
jgi:hypothetical protein